MQRAAKTVLVGSRENLSPSVEIVQKVVGKMISYGPYCIYYKSTDQINKRKINQRNFFYVLYIFMQAAAKNIVRASSNKDTFSRLLFCVLPSARLDTKNAILVSYCHIYASALEILMMVWLL
jgi:hypothetical protein